MRNILLCRSAWGPRRAGNPNQRKCIFGNKPPTCDDFYAAVFEKLAPLTYSRVFRAQDSWYQTGICLGNLCEFLCMEAPHEPKFDQKPKVPKSSKISLRMSCELCSCRVQVLLLVSFCTFCCTAAPSAPFGPYACMHSVVCL